MTGTLSSASVSIRSYRKSVIDALWLEYRAAAQYAKVWDRAEENVALIRRKAMSGTLPTQDDLAGLAPASRSGGSAAFWMSQIHKPGWFIYDELGIGTGTNVFDTMLTLKRTNTRRQKRYEARLEQLAKARQVLSRTVRG